MKNKPNAELFLEDVLFNSMINALDYFIASEVQIGEIVQTQQAAKLKEKILTHGRAYDYNGEPNASIYLYGVEPALMMKLLTIFINRGEELPPPDYYSQLKQRRNNLNKKGVGIPTFTE